MYADYNYYANEYCQGMKNSVIPQEKTEFYLKKASMLLNSLFVSRKPRKPYDYIVCDTCCEIADCLYRLEKREGISKEENDGYAVTYSQNALSSYRAAYDIAVRNLGASGLLYRGIDL